MVLPALGEGFTEEDPMYVPSEAEVELRKGKERDEAGVRTALLGAERCMECVVKGVKMCMVDLLAIEKYERDVEESRKTLVQTPGGATCKTCVVRKQKCILLRMLRLKEEREEHAEAEKRKRREDGEDEEVEKEKPKAKKAKRVAGSVRAESSKAGSSGSAEEMPVWVAPLVKMGKKLGRSLRQIAESLETIVDEIGDGWYEPGGESESEEYEMDREDLALEMEEMRAVVFVTGNPRVFLGPPAPTPALNPYPQSWVRVYLGTGMGTVTSRHIATSSPTPPTITLCRS